MDRKEKLKLEKDFYDSEVIRISGLSQNELSLPGEFMPDYFSKNYPNFKIKN